MKTEKNNIILALLFSLLATIGGAAAFGLIYYIGYYIYYLTAAEIIIACNLFFKFKKPKSWKTIFLAVFWGIVWTFIFNTISVMVCESIITSKEFEISFLDSFLLLIQLWGTEPEVASYMNITFYIINITFNIIYSKKNIPVNNIII